MTNMNTAPYSAHRIDVNTRRLRNSFKAGILRLQPVPNKRHNAVAPIMDFLPISSSSISSRIGSIDCIADTSVTDFSDSRTSTPSTGENMEAKLLDYFDGVPSDWNNRPGCLPAPQDLDWLLPYSIDINSPLYDTNFPMEDLLALEMPSPTFTSSCFSMEQSSPSQSMHQYMGISTPDSLPELGMSYPNHTPRTEQTNQGSETHQQLSISMSVPEHTSHSTITKEYNYFSLVCQLQDKMDSQVPLGILLIRSEVQFDRGI
ncbi:hypothetical protein CCUS01_00532 [Colletotrichum cuscutae]|uniref:Uncharacterized protein n=1 Tax=Colletotrichum cuscutae TaxID=1209917 RepID=A0AAI9VAK1_9PEZI|nr:hypothetical protein CCUS01_00532 [Colletotrichum cuscutae]